MGKLIEWNSEEMSWKSVHCRLLMLIQYALEIDET